jgi:hypothetical protein
MKKILTVALFLLLAEKSNCQFLIKQIDFSGNVKVLSNDSLLSIPLLTFDTIVIKQLEVPKNIEDDSKCYCQGTVCVSYILYNQKLLETKITKSVSPKFDSILSKQNLVVFNNLVKYIKIDPDKFYFIIVPIRYKLDEYDEVKEDKIYKQYSKPDSLTKLNYIYVLMKDIKP